MEAEVITGAAVEGTCGILTWTGCLACAKTQCTWYVQLPANVIYNRSAVK